MSYLEDRYFATFVINKIDDPIPPLSYPVTVGVPGELFGALRPGVSGEGLNPLNDTQAIGIDAGVLPFDSIFEGENDL